jgi:pyruvate kinase
MVDLAGPKVRIGPLHDGEAKLAAGTVFKLRSSETLGDSTGASTNHPNLPDDLQPGDLVSLADGAVELRVTSVNDEVVTEVVTGGTLRSRAGVSVPSDRLSLPAIMEKDLEDITRVREFGVDYIAQSFVRRAADVHELRDVLGKPPIPIVAKIETGAAVDAVDDILEAADAVMLARGDLGVDVELERVPLIQKEITQRAVQRSRPIIIATQMLESMTGSPRPTRAEVTDVANAVLENADAVMLSSETAIGAYPVTSVQTAARIASETELHGAAFVASSPRWIPEDPAEAVARAAAEIAAANSSIAAIACFTESGRVAQLLSQARPRVPIAAFCAHQTVARRLTLHRAVYPFIAEPMSDTDAVIGMLDAGLQNDLGLDPGTEVILVASSPARQGTTNLLKLHRIGDWPSA